MPLVLSNDDGVEAEGLETLHSVLASRSDCVIVAPAGPQSGVGHAVTTDAPLRLDAHGPRRFGVAGTPADCARVALARDARFATEALENADPRDIWLVAGIMTVVSAGVIVWLRLRRWL